MVWSLREEPQEELPLLVGIKCGRQDDVSPGVERESVKHTSLVNEHAGGRLLVNRVATVVAVLLHLKKQSISMTTGSP